MICLIFDQPPAAAAARRYEQMRRDRNRNRYDARPVTTAAATVAEQTANMLVTEALTRL